MKRAASIAITAIALCFVAGLALYLCFSSHIARELREVQDTY